MVFRRLTAAFALLIVPLGCNTLLGIDDATRQDANATAGSAGSGAAGAAGGPAAGTGGQGASAGAAGSNGNGNGSSGEAPAPPCDESEAPGEGVFVDPRVGDDENDGTMIRPYRTLARATTEAVARSLETLYLAPGSYQEALALRAGAESAPGEVAAPEGTRLSFDGGWAFEGARWRRDCSTDAREKTVLASTSTTGVSLRGPFGPVAFHNLSIVTAAAPPPVADGQPGANCYGVNASGAGLRLRLHNVEIDACPGGDGGAALPVSPPPPFSCVETGDKCSNGAPGADAQALGAPADVGSFDSEGFLNGDGALGEVGEPGATGTIGPGQAGPLVCFFSDSLCCDVTTQIPHGRCGCGGLAGFGGPGGRGGGASIALFVRGPNATVDLAFATLRAHDGGDGAPGGEGSLGGPGVPGAAYQGLADCCAGCDGQCFLQGCGSLPAQPAGGPGGPGGKGSKGGGGSGGPSFALVRVGDVELTQAETVLSFGRPGDGVEGAPAGEAGEQTSVSAPAPGGTLARGALAPGGTLARGALLAVRCKNTPRAARRPRSAPPDR